MTTPSADVLKNMIDNLEKNMTVMENNLVDKIEDYKQSSIDGHGAILKSISDMQKEMRESNGWKNKFMGALGVIMVVVFPIMSWALYEIVNLDNKIEAKITQVLDDNFTITDEKGN